MGGSRCVDFVMDYKEETMLTKIAENIYCKLVPLPNNPLRDINVYIIKGDDGRALIIDTGFNRPECEEALQSAFDELGIESPDVFITHLHSDHVGLVPKFAGEGRVLIRPSGTEPKVRVMIEGKDQKVIEEEARKLADLIQNTML